jgi:hypothetical protein
VSTELTRFTGLSGTVKITAPLPGSDVTEFTALVAVTFAKILDPYAKLNGAPIRDYIGTVHALALIMSALVPSQSVV